MPLNTIWLKCQPRRPSRVIHLVKGHLYKKGKPHYKAWKPGGYCKFAVSNLKVLLNSIRHCCSSYTVALPLRYVRKGSDCCIFSLFFPLKDEAGSEFSDLTPIFWLFLTFCQRHFTKLWLGREARRRKKDQFSWSYMECTFLCLLRVTSRHPCKIGEVYQRP